jgi:hypothetical protein
MHIYLNPFYEILFEYSGTDLRLNKYLLYNVKNIFSGLFFSISKYLQTTNALHAMPP